MQDYNVCLSEIPIYFQCPNRCALLPLNFPKKLMACLSKRYTSCFRLWGYYMWGEKNSTLARHCVQNSFEEAHTLSGHQKATRKEQLDHPKVLKSTGFSV